MTIEKTTESAEELIDRYSDDPKVAVILASTFIHARLRTIVNVYLKQRGRSDVSVVNENVDLKPTLKIAYALGTITFSEFSMLNDLAVKRNNIAHKSKFWRKPKPAQEQTYLRLATFASSFLRSTGSLKLIHMRLAVRNETNRRNATAK